MVVRRANIVCAMLCGKVREFVASFRSFGFVYAWAGFVWWICFYLRPPFAFKVSTWALSKKTEFLDRYIAAHYADILNSYRDISYAGKRVKVPRIWVFWGQGEENMPPLVKACYQQLISHNENVTLVTVRNVTEFIDLSPDIIKKVRSGKLSWAHYSDIVRTTLLAKHGGLWLDATVWVAGAIPFTKLEEMSIFTANGKVPSNSKSICFWTSMEWNWSSWCLYAREQNNLLFLFVSEMLQAMALREKCWPDYVIQDYLIHYACRTFPEVRDAMESMNIECANRNQLANLMNQTYDSKVYAALINTDFLFKLSFRAPWVERDSDGNMTFYGYLLSNLSKQCQGN